MTEKIAMADGRADAPVLLEACRNSAKSFFGADLAAAAERTGSVISAVLFGALAQSRTLPFDARSLRGDDRARRRRRRGEQARLRGGRGGGERGCGRGRRRR